MRCFVTGGTGLVGQSVVKALRQAGHETVVLTTSPGKVELLRALGAEPVVGDMREAARWKDHASSADAIIHMGQLPMPTRITKRRLGVGIDADLRATRLLLDAASEACKAFVYTSGLLIYGPGTTPRSEDAPLCPYAMAAGKLRGERIALEAHQSRKLPVMVLRLGVVYGPRGLFKTLYVDPMVRGKRARYPGNGRQIYSYVHCDDAAAAYLRCVESPAPGEIFNVADSEPVATGVFLTEMARRFEAPQPGGLPALIFKLATGLIAEPLLSDNVVSSAKMQEQLGVQLRYPTYREGLAALAHD